jgi:glycosyltransferase involved in cell wall biosynthesis
MGNNLVSIAMATYNGSRFLREQLDSIYAQTFKNIEVVVCDDCSGDETPRILEEYRIRHGLKYSINKTNLGFIKNFEKAIKLCSGECIALADQDDIWLPEKIETLMQYINGVSLVCSDASLCDENGAVFAKSMKKYANIPAVSGKPTELLIFRNFVTGCTSMFKKELLEKALPIPEGAGSHDWWFALVASKLNGIKYLDKQLVLYRQHGMNDIGAKESPGFLEKMKEVKTKFQKKAFEKEIRNLRAMKTLFLLSEYEKKIIDDRTLFYENILNSRIHIKSFIIALKYNNYMLAKRNIIYRALFLLGVLFV